MIKQASFIAAVAVVALAPFAHADEGTPEQRSYEGRMDRQIREWIHDGNHEATDEERHFIEEHWSRAERLWRARELAEAAHDTASVHRADALLARADRTLEIQLGRFRGRAPVMTVAPPVFETTQAPPPPQVETRGVAPPGDTWVGGFWGWNGSRYVWNRGHWQAPPQVGMSWEEPKWENRAGKWSFSEGRWRAVATAPTVVYEPPPAQPEVVVETAPPPPIVEVRPPAPPNGVWIGGYWHWNGSRHTWVGGHWSATKPGMKWEPDHWVREGKGWKMEHGRWTR